MAIHNEQVRQMGAGQAKTINAGAMGMVLDTLQRYQYIYPVQSTIREIASNAVDSIREKNVAKQILSGTAKVEDFFVEREGEQYTDSHFDPTYYSLDCLSNNDTVIIHYISGGSTAADKVVISDSGVGLGDRRLEGYFEMGYSTKRLSKLPLGKWGIGAKSPLSVGVDYYTIESVHNGKRYRFNIYAHSYDSIIPQYNLESGNENNAIIFALGTDHEYKVYYEETEAKNGVTITIGAKKHHKKQYLDAVRSQLLYFSGIQFLITDEDGITHEENYRAKILYEDEYIILSDNNYYTKPHLLLNGVNYGYINWEELELQDRTGNIGIKVAPEDIEVTPSRESVIWSEKTKMMVNQRFLDVQEIASKAIQEELKETDFWKWVKTCFSIGTRYSHNGNDVISRLSRIVDINTIQPKYLPDPRIKFTPMGIFDALTVRFVCLRQTLRQNKQVIVVDRGSVKSIGSYIGSPVFYIPRGESYNNRRDKFLLKELGENGFITIHEPTTIEHMRSANFSEEEIAKREEYLAKESGVSPTVLYDLMVASEGVMDYTKVEVPEDFKATDLDEVEKEEEKKTEEEKVEAKVTTITAAERRKSEGKIIIYTPRLLGRAQMHTWTTEEKDENGYPYTKTYHEERLSVSQKLEQKISEINNWEEEEIYYGTEADDEVIHLVAAITRDRNFRNDMVNHAVRTVASTVNFYTVRNGSETKKIEGWTDKKWYRLNKEKLYSNFGISTLIDISTIYQAETAAYNCQHFFDNREIKLVKVAQANVKYVRDFKHIQEFFISIRNHTISMSNLLVKWNTARLIKESLHKVAFLYNYEQFNTEYADKYEKLKQYIATHYNEIKEQSGNNYYGLNKGTYNDLISHLDNVYKFQKFVMDNSEDKATIAALAEDLFGNNQLQNGMAVEPEIVDILSDVLEYGNAVGDLLNWMPRLTGLVEYEWNYSPTTVRMPKIPVLPHIEHEIKLYLESKGVLDYGTQTNNIEVQTPNQNDRVYLSAPEPLEFAGQDGRDSI